MKTKFILPIVSIGPPFDYSMDYKYSLDNLTKHMVDGDYLLSIERKHFYKGKLIKSNKANIEYKEKKWYNEQAATYKCDSIFKSRKEWLKAYDQEYIETHVEILKGGYFKNIMSYTPSTYAIFASKNKKTFFSDNQYKFGESRTIDQITQFGKWLEGYPDTNYSKKNNIDESLIFINPYPAKTNVRINLLSFTKSLNINAYSSVRIPLSSLLNKDVSEWSGQIFISGKNRQILFFLKHALNDASNITTLEHSENFRGEPTHYSLSNTFHRIKQRIKQYI